MRWFRNQHRQRPRLQGRIGVCDELSGTFLIAFVLNHGNHNLASIFRGIDPELPGTEKGHPVRLDRETRRELRHGQEWTFADLQAVELVAPGRKRKRKIPIRGLHIDLKSFLALRIDHLEGAKRRSIYSLRLSGNDRDDPPHHQGLRDVSLRHCHRKLSRAAWEHQAEDTQRQPSSILSEPTKRHMPNYNSAIRLG